MNTSAVFFFGAAFGAMAAMLLIILAIHIAHRKDRA